MIYEILLLWCQLTGKNIKFFYKSSEGQAIVKMLRNNSKIKRMIIDKEYYFDKNDVFFEFFKTQPLLKEVIKKMGIFDYDDLVSRKWWIHI